jgi:ubiquinone/menaquinone biosynthesis C-methylase UbiE
MQDANNIQTEYEQWHKDYNKNILAYDKLNMMKWHHTVMSLIDDDLSGKKMLEVGCGNGDFSNYLALNRNATISGLDFSTESIKIAEEKKKVFGAVGSSFMVGDAQNISLPDNSYDIIVSCECLEHVPEPQKMINEIFRLLKPGGKVVLTTENYFNAYAYYRVYLKLIGKPFDSGSGVQPLENFFFFWQVCGMFKKAGFQNLKTNSSEYVMMLLPGTDPATFTINEVKSRLMKNIMKPFGRRMTYIAVK